MTLEKDNFSTAPEATPAPAHTPSHDPAADQLAEAAEALHRDAAPYQAHDPLDAPVLADEELLPVEPIFEPHVFEALEPAMEPEPARHLGVEGLVPELDDAASPQPAVASVAAGTTDPFLDAAALLEALEAEEPPFEPAAEAAGNQVAARPEPAHLAPAEEPAASGAVPSFLAASAGAASDAAGNPDAAEAAPAAEPAPELSANEAAPRPEDTAEIDVQAVEDAVAEAAVSTTTSDPGVTQGFAPVTEDLIDTASTFDAGTTTSLMWGARSDVGCVRNHNEDSYLVQSPLFCVCDGMGGHAAGEVASAIAVETIAKTAPHAADPALLGAAIEAANAAIIEAAVNGIGRPGMGCTATAAYIEGNTIAIAHVGDSRAYLLHEGTLIRVTRDHSYVEELVDAGEITADEARVHPNRSVITRALGSDPAMYADHFQLSIEEGDRLILCSDGLSSMISDSEIERIATQSSTAQICTDNLVDAALAAGGSDNVTVIAVDVVDDGKLRKFVRTRRRTVIATFAAIMGMLAIMGVVAALTISNSVYLGAKDGAVAIYKGVPGSFAGVNLHWLEDETSVMLTDLPEDTQKRLAEGIPQESVDAAADTVAKYREQIVDTQVKQAANADAVRRGAVDSGAVADAAEARSRSNKGGDAA